MQDLVERYVIRANHEWAFIYIDERHGIFSCYSSYGTYAYCWSHIGVRTLKEFLSGLDFDYFMKKARGPGYMRFDFDLTVKGMKEYIVETRRHGGLSKLEAREAWTDIDEIEDNHSADLFCEQIYWSKPINRVYGGDYCDICRESPDPQCTWFWKVIWPEFLKRIAVPVAA